MDDVELVQTAQTICAAHGYPWFLVVECTCGDGTPHGVIFGHDNEDACLRHAHELLAKEKAAVGHIMCWCLVPEGPYWELWEEHNGRWEGERRIRPAWL